MRGVALWALGAAVAFLATASTFLLLANLLGDPTTSDPIPRAEPSETEDPEPTLVLELPEDRLEGLEKIPGQRLALDLRNGGDEELTGVELALDVASENTAWPRLRSYRETVERLGAQESATIEFEIDLSPPIPPEGREQPGFVEGKTREILEVRATTPEGEAAVKTAVLAP